MTKNKDWNTIVDGNSKRPQKDEVVVGYFISGPYKFAELCYYDPESDEWFSASPDTYDDPVNKPDYWIEKP